VAGNSAVGGNGAAGGAAGTGTFSGLAAAGGTGGGGYGGGIYNAGVITLRTSTLSGNSTSGGSSAAGGSQSSGIGTRGPDGGSAVGGAFCNASYGVITNSTFYNNTATGGSGGNGGNGTGTFATAGPGGNGGNGVGGCVQNSSTLTIVNCTIMLGGAYGGTNGHAGSGLFGASDGQPGQSQGGNVANSSGSCTLMNSLIAWSPWGGCGYGTITDGGYNLTTDATIPLVDHGYPNIADPKLGAFGMNGGPTPTVPLLTNSPALNVIPTNSCPATDQRGLPRIWPQDEWGDIGAYESDTTSAPFILQQPANQSVPQSSPATFSVFAVGASPLSYQWFFQGSLITNATNSSYTIGAVFSSNQGPYQVVISNSINTTTSAVASLNAVIGVSGTVREGTNGLPGVNVAIGTNQVVVTGVDGTYNASLPSGTYLLTPTLTNYGFSPGSWNLTLAAPTNNINFAGLPLIRLTLMTNGTAQIYGGGINGLTYQIEASTNFLQWQAISTNVAPIQFSDPVGGQRQKFYRFSR